jgi:hypothetical protein
MSALHLSQNQQPSLSPSSILHSRWPPGRRKREKGEEGEEERGRKEEEAAPPLEDVTGEPLYAATSPEMEEEAPQAVIFNLKLMKVTGVDLRPRATPSQAAAHGGPL